MPALTSPSLLTLADEFGGRACAGKGREERLKEGQFFTPVEVARHLAGWFGVEGLNRRSLHLVDPGAGGGALTAGFMEQVCGLKSEGKLPQLREVTLEAWEPDEHFAPALGKTLRACGKLVEESGLRAVIQQHDDCYIASACAGLGGDLFGSGSPVRATHAILNPPYRKLSARSRERALLRQAGLETSNLYAAFVWLALRQLESGGELAAITPRSFCNGPYFRDFRQELVRLADFRQVHLIDSRKEAFGRDAVLQENILFHLTRGKEGGKTVALSTGSLASPEKKVVPMDEFISPRDPDRVIHLPTGEDSNEVRHFVQSLPCTLAELGIEVSTGPVVDFRLKDNLSRELKTGEVPLLYPHTVRPDGVTPPRQCSDDYPDKRMAKKPVAIAVNDETRRWLLPVDRFVLIKRFSSKEEKRRLVAGVLETSEFEHELIGLENHLNFFHRKRAGLEEDFARGLSRFLNSTVADLYFRQFNGHTQVNASDLKSFRYPERGKLEQLGREALDDSDQIVLDRALAAILGAPSFDQP